MDDKESNKGVEFRKRVKEKEERERERERDRKRGRTTWTLLESWIRREVDEEE